jgi:hypothetical protein
MPRGKIPTPNRAANLWAAMSWPERWAFVLLVLGRRNEYRPARIRRRAA